MMKTRIAQVLAVIFGGIIGLDAAPRLVVSTPSLAPETTIDLVLDKAVIPVAEIGGTTVNDWLEIEPAWPGKLRWKAENIAEFLPEGPPAIGMMYEFSVPGGRQHVDGSEVEGGRVMTVSAEDFQIPTVRTLGERWRSDYSVSTGEWLVFFNDAVDPAAVAGFVVFASTDGQRVAARVGRATSKQAGYYGNRYRPWAERIPTAERPQRGDDDVLPNVLVVSPVEPLPPGKGWQLHLMKGVPNEGGIARLGKERSFRVGDIKPFEVKEIKARVQANEPRQIVVSFTHPLPKELPDGFLEQAILIEPRPEELAAKVSGNVVTITGGLSERDQYQVNVAKHVRSVDGFALKAGKNQKLEFHHLAPGVALPSEDVGQLAKGERKYRVETLNMESVRVRMKKLAGPHMIRAFQGYRHFTGNGPDHQEMSPTAPVPYELIVGRTVLDKEIVLGNPVDTTKVVTLDWNELLPDKMRYGVFFMEVTGEIREDCGKKKGSPKTQAIIQLTDLGLAWKLTEEEAMVYAFSCDSGKPLHGVNLRLFGEDAERLGTAVTDEYGLATLPRGGGARHMLARLDNDSYVTAFDESMETVGMWHFPVRYSWNAPQDNRRRAFLFTDRSLYRPGETVRLKGVVRNQRGNAIVGADESSPRVVIVDPTNREIYTRDVELSGNGTFDVSVKLPEEKTGYHRIQLEYPDELQEAEESDDWWVKSRLMQSAKFMIPLQVEEFRRNAFEVTQEIVEPEIGAAVLKADVVATYYQGEAVAAGKVRSYTSVATRNPYPERFRDFLFGNHRSYDWGYWYHYFGYGENREGEVKRKSVEAVLSSAGRALVEVEIPEAEFPEAREVTVSTAVTDANEQTLTARSTAVVHPASVYVGVSRIDRLVRAGEDLPLKVVAIDTRHQPWDGALAVTAKLTREVNHKVKTRTASGATTTRNDVVEELVNESQFMLEPQLSAGGGQEIVVKPEATGLHFLTLSGTDADGRKFATVSRFHVYGTDEYPWQYEDGIRVKLVAEKRLYQPGETARVLVLSPIEGTALVTVEREKVLRSFRVELKADDPVIEIPLTDDDAPNAFVSVLVVKGAAESAREFKAPQLRLGYCELTVENRRDRLAVELDPGSESYRPGEEIEVTGSVKLADGSPAVGAEVTLYAEDEGTLAVMGYRTPRPMDEFYDPRLLEVRAGTSFTSFVPENPDEQYFHNKGMFIGGGGGEAELAAMMRKNFDPCATWAPALETDSQGNFAHRFTLPDTLTRYRVIAVVVHGDARFGHGESSVVAKKDLMLEPKAPRFVHQTDEVTPQVLVQNASGHDGEWEVVFKAHAADGSPVCRALGETVARVSLDAGKSTVVRFPVTVEGTGEAVFSWTAVPVSLRRQELTPELTKRLSDAVETRIESVYPMPLLRQVKFVRMNEPGVAKDLRAMLDGNLLDGRGSLDLEFSRSQLAEAAGAVDYLLKYPYGCVEQTTSSLIPWCAVDELRDYVPGFGGVSEQKVKAAIQTGADRLLAMQRNDGSFGYWPDSRDTCDWATPYAGMGLVLASNEGAVVPDAAMKSLTQYLVKSLRGLAKEASKSHLEIHARTLMVLSMAGEPQTSYQNAMIDRLPDLTASSRAMLAVAIAGSGEGNHAANLAVARDVLTSRVPPADGEQTWMRYQPDRALELMAWTLIDPDGPEAAEVLERMFRDRNPYGHWHTTWMNGWSLVAMGMVAAADESRSESVAIQLETHDGAKAIQLSAENPTAVVSLKVGPNMKLAVSSDHSAFVRMRLAAKPPVAPLKPVAKNGLSVDRLYELVKPDGTREPMTEPKVGDLIRVTLRVTLPKDGSRYLVIEDPLPSVFETVNSDFASQSSAMHVPTSEHDWHVSHSELRDDRAVFFLDHVWNKGTYEVSYLARCTLAGKVVVPQAKVESMYDPDQFALSASRVIAVK